MEELGSNAENRADRTHIGEMKRFAKQARSKTMETPVVEKAPAKTEAELIATVANIRDAERCLLFAQRATRAGMPALTAACEERAKALTPIKPARAKRKPAPIKAAKVNPPEQPPA
jgi:hypothetical protein